MTKALLLVSIYLGFVLVLGWVLARWAPAEADLSEDDS